MELPKQMVVAYATDLPTTVKLTRSSPSQKHAMEAPDKLELFAYRDAISAESDNNTVYGEEVNKTSNRIGALHHQFFPKQWLSIKQLVRIRHSKTVSA